ncbi:hypothetical protein PHYSODRAFT_565176 [Phytophthora sojae]|uniref:Surfeit locus protein 2 n=1 Tax=Phytophthora sojae (strain P6497) TaxID=1094619 RepID=G5A967_PHYSP|nr:hypothetical protein PHYSODRAFT_565176 [Phytophthora sojae]EGZ08443.1 hypothetical protein PHYSODRAFT_565176 [Phytophthora sojae]|eukprot:XP_009536615.1 hypothetical protein PHYSODRAFT_565176 [Phytophthora sojae]
MASSALEPAVQQLLSKHEFLELVETGESDGKRVRVKCGLTQHEMLPRADVIETHLKSKKFVKARDWYCHDYSQYEPYIVPHRRLAKSLYCNVTGTILNRIPAEVEKHVQGKRYKRMKQHVKVKVQRSEDDQDGNGMPVNGEFDADAFEFANSQDDMADLYPDDESDEEENKDKDGGETMEEKPKKNKRPAKGNSAPKKTRHKSKKVKKAD